MSERTIASTAETTSSDPTSPDYERAVVVRWGQRDSAIRSFWQSSVVASEINRRVTGDSSEAPAAYFTRAYCSTPRGRALSLGCGDGQLELSLLALGACERMVAVDLSPSRLDRVRAAAPPDVIDRLELVCANLESWRPEGRFDLVVANGVIHHLEGLERIFDLIDQVLTDNGLLYLDEYVGPSRFQWTDQQLRIINRLLDRLSPELRHDLVLPELGVRPEVTRPAVSELIAADPSEAARSAEIRNLLRDRFQVIEERPWGGAIVHQLFNRIMGNFSGHDDLVRVIMELDAILTDEGVVDSDFLWGVYARRPRASGDPRATGRVDGRVEAVEGGRALGWAFDEGQPERRLGVDVYIDHRLVAKAVADLPRPDLVREKVGDGAHAFEVQLPGWACDGGHHALSVAVPSAGATLRPARGWDARNRSEPSGARFSLAKHVDGLELPAARVLGGVDGWAFPCLDTVGSLEQMRGRLVLTEPDLRHYRELVSARVAWLADLGIPYVLAIVPAKAAIHADRLPPTSPELSAPRLADQLQRALMDTGATVADLLGSLRSAAQSGSQTYQKRDSRWNSEGALVASLAVLETAREAGVPAAELIPIDIRWVRETVEGDLAGRPSVVFEQNAISPGPLAGGPEPSKTPEEQSLGIRPAAGGDDLGGRGAWARTLESPKRSGAPTALVLSDHVGERARPFLAAGFSRSTWMLGWELDPALVKAQRPAVVIQLLEEAQLVRVPYGVFD